MKRLLVVLVLLLAGVVGLGFYRGWFHLSTDNSDARPNVTLEVDKGKIEADEGRLQDLGHRAKGTVGDRTDTAKEQ